MLGAPGHFCKVVEVLDSFSEVVEAAVCLYRSKLFVLSCYKSGMSAKIKDIFYDFPKTFRVPWMSEIFLSLSYIRLLCPTRDCSFPQETALSHIRVLCPIIDCSV